MNEQIEEAREELKRIDHLIYVTLKYTRTVDVLISIVDRMINAYEFTVDAIINDAKERGEIPETSEIPVARAIEVKRLITSKIIKDNIDTYLLFRKLKKVTNYEKTNEYRRHVSMKTKVDDEDIEINIDNITEKYHNLKKFIDYITQYIEGKEK